VLSPDDAEKVEDEVSADEPKSADVEAIVEQAIRAQHSPSEQRSRHS
jgi:hypothetical protein